MQVLEKKNFKKSTSNAEKRFETKQTSTGLQKSYEQCDVRFNVSKKLRELLEN